MADFTTYGTGYSLDSAGGPAWVPSGSTLGPKYVVPFRGPVYNQGFANQAVAYAAASIKAHQEFKEHRAYLDFDINIFIQSLGSFDGILVGAGSASGSASATATSLGFFNAVAAVSGTSLAEATGEITNEDEGFASLLATSTADATAAVAYVGAVALNASSTLSGTADPGPVVPPVVPPAIPTGYAAEHAVALLSSYGYLARPEVFKLESAFPFSVSDAFKLLDLDEIKDAVLTNGPVLLGMELDSGFRTVSSPYVLDEPTGTVTERHAFVVCGWDDDKETELGTGAILLKNSWGTEYGDSGFVWMGYNYLDTYIFDAWAVVDSTEILP